jgi:hypothetical protein
VESGVKLLCDVDGLLEMPLLEDLLISYPEGAEGGEVSGSVLPIVFNAPKLKRLSLYFAADILSHFVLPWDQITHFSYGSSRPLHVWGKVSSNLLEVLQRLPNLTYLHFIAGLNIQSIRPQHITLSNLRVLEINDHRLFVLGRQPNILSCLRAPLLERFDLVIPIGTHIFGSKPYNYASQQLASFFQTSSHLQQFRVVLIFWHEGCGVTFIEPGTTSRPYYSVYASGKAPIFRDLSSKFPPKGYIKMPDYVKLLNLPVPLPGDGFYTLDRFIDRFLKHDDFESSSGGPSTECIDRVVHRMCYPVMKNICDMLSGFSNDDLNMEFYLQAKD